VYNDARVCNDYFICGKPADVTANNIDWAPSINFPQVAASYSSTATSTTSPEKKQKLLRCTRWHHNLGMPVLCGQILKNMQTWKP